jgi:hypothetical protein
MVKPRYFLFVIFYAAYLMGAYFLGRASKNNRVLGLSYYVSSPTPSPTDTPTPSPTATATPTSTPTAVPTDTPKPKPTITPVSSQEVNAFIERFSAQYGVDPNVIRHLAICESGFRSNAIQGIYVGLFQFGPVTWKNIRLEFGEDTNPDLRYSAEESVQTAAYAYSKGKKAIWPNCFP